MVRKITWSFAILVALVLGIPAACFYLLGYTEAGLRFVVDNLPERVGRVTLRAEGVSGTLSGGFTLRRFTLEHERVSLRIEGTSGRLAMLPLLWQTIEAHDLRVQYAYAGIRARVTPPPVYTPRFLPRFLTIASDDIRIARAEVKLINGFVLDGRDVRASGIARHKTIRFTQSHAIIGDLEGTGTGLLTAADPMQIEGATHWRYTPRNQPPWVATADLRGDLNKLPFTVRITEPMTASIGGELLTLTKQWRWIGKARISDFDLRAWGAGGALGRITGDLALSGNRDGFRAQGPLDSAGLAAGPFDALFEGNWVRGALRADRIQLVHQQSRSTVEAKGEIRVVENGPQLELAGDWSQLRWPLVGAAPAIVKSGGNFTFSGRWPYSIVANGQFDSPDLGETIPFSMSGQLAKAGLTISRGDAKLYDGTAQLRGQVGWTPAESWQLAGTMRGLNPGRVRSALPGSIGFDFDLRGDAFGPEANLDAQFSNLQGRVRGAAARGRGRIQRQGQGKELRWLFEGINIAAGGLRLAADGQLSDESYDLDFRLDADDLGVISEQSRGALTARGTLGGTLREPLLRGTATGRGIDLEGIKLGTLDADIDFDPRSGKTSNVRIEARRIEAFGRSASVLDFTLRGQAEQHSLTLDASAPNGRLRLRADGGFSSGTWRGAWREVSIDDDAQLHLKLEQPAAIQASIDAGRLELFCLRGEQARLCASADWNPERWVAATSANELPIAALTAGLTPKVVYEGKLDIKASAFGNAGKPVQGSLRADLTGAQLRRKRVNGREDLIELGSGFVTGEATPDAFNGRVELDAGETGKISGDARVQRTAAALDDMPLRASLRVSTTALGFVNLYFPDIDRAAGRLEADLAVGGTVGSPLINGVARLRNGELDLYQVNLALRAAELEARLIDSGVTFKGSAKAGAGQLATNGTVQWRDSLPYGDISIKGEDLLLVNVPEARITASPALAFKITGRRIDISGEVLIPQATIQPADLTGAVLSSSDEVILGEVPRDPEQSFRIASRVRMVLGEKVTLDTFGLSGRLTGSLTADTGVDGISRGTGELAVADGKYAALGRRLDIQRGRLIFSGGLLADPGIDLRAQKQFPDVLAGVNVRGTLRDPRMTFFSEPSLPQSQIVSLILAGGTFESAQSADRDAASRRSEVLAQGGAILAQQLGAKVGIEDIGIEQNLSNETSLVLGKYLSPRLYISYGISLAESINTIKMRYTLGDRWTLRTEAGKERSAEIVYTIEK